MRQIKIEELKRLQYEMLISIDEYCRKNNIRYILAYGTLLGAIRHRGYIPWDDDIDIAMPRPDYERFISGYNDYHKDYKVVHSGNYNLYSLPYAKVNHLKTLLVKDLYQQDGLGVNIDVFPIDGYKESYQITRSKRLFKYLNAKKSIITNKRSFVQNSTILLAKAFLLFKSTRSIIMEIESLSKKVPFSTSNLVTNFGSPYTNKEIFPREMYENLVEVEFEGKKFPAPYNYDSYLSAIYRDYMTPPPIDKRDSTHHVTFYWK